MINYSVVSYFCRTVWKHGGVLIFVENDMKYKTLKCNVMNKECVSEFCLVELYDLELVVILLYRSCSVDFNTFLLNFETILHIFIKNRIVP